MCSFGLGTINLLFCDSVAVLVFRELHCFLLYRGKVMKKSILKKRTFNRDGRFFALLPIALATQISLAASEPAQKPMLTTLTGAKPNIVIMLDNSGSMRNATTISQGLSTRVGANGLPVDSSVTGNNAIFQSYYSRRYSATATALGIALSSQDFDNKFRLGYGVINGVGQVLGRTDLPSSSLVQGVADFTGTHKTNFYNWLYDTYSTQAFNNGGTPLHNAVNLVGLYYGTDEPWDSSATNSEKLSCRKSYNILFTDGAWNRKELVRSYGDNSTYNNIRSPWTQSYYDSFMHLDNQNSSTSYTGRPNGLNASFRYDRRGVSNTSPSVDPKKPWTQGYVPYGDNIRSGLSDLTARYFWHTDFRTDIENNIPVQAKSGDPSFWQNMKTFVIGYQVAPTSFNLNQVETYKNNFLEGLSPSMPTWPVPNRCLTWRGQSGFGFLNQASGPLRFCRNNGTWPTWQRLRMGRGNSWYLDPDLVRNPAGWRWTGENGRIDDALRAGYTGGGRSYSVSTPQEVTAAFEDIVSKALDGSGNDAGVAVSSGSSEGLDFLEGDLKITVNYDIKENAGDIVAYRVNADGDVINQDGSGVPVGGGAIPSWSAKERLPSPSARRLYVKDGSAVKTISSTSNLSAFGSVNASLLNSTNYFKTDNAFAAWLMGEAGEKNRAGEDLRELTSGIASIVNAAPVFAGANLDMAYDWALLHSKDGGSTMTEKKTAVDAALRYIGTSTSDGSNKAAAFFALKKDAPATIYAATNSGLVHVLNGAKPMPATGDGTTNAPVGKKAGEELAVYLPSGAMSKMAKFAGEGVFDFQYATDGPIVESDVYDKNKGKWRQMLFGSGGRGGKFAYALNAINLTSNKREPGASDFMWEQRAEASGSDVEDLSFLSNSIVVGQLRSKGAVSGKWVALVGSGHYPKSGKKVGLYVLNALTGEEEEFIELPSAYQAGNDGLGGVTAVRDAGRRLVAAYAGDAKGNLWRFDLRNQDSLKLSYGKPLFETKDDKPIYAAPTWQPHIGGKLPNNTICKPQTVKEKLEADGKATEAAKLPETLYSGNCGTMIGFATGILLDDDHAQSTAQQTIYGFWDPTPIGGDDLPVYNTLREINAGSRLVEQRVLSEDSQNGFYKVTENTVDYGKGERGWFLNMNSIPNLPTLGERVIGDPFNLGSSFFFTSVVSSATSQQETCEASSSLPNVLYGLDAHTGGLKRSFDVNGDGKPDEFSVGYIERGGFTRSNAVRSSSTEGDGQYPFARGPINEGLVNLRPMADCTSSEGRQTGVANETENIYDGCADDEWKRNWRQILNVPTS